MGLGDLRAIPAVDQGPVGREPRAGEGAQLVAHLGQQEPRLGVELAVLGGDRERELLLGVRVPLLAQEEARLIEVAPEVLGAPGRGRRCAENRRTTDEKYPARKMVRRSSLADLAWT